MKLGRLIISCIFIALIFASTGCTEKLQGKTIIRVNVEISEDDNGRPVIEDIQAVRDTVGPLQEFKDTPVNTPGVFITTTNTEGRKIDYWVSEAYTGPGSYELVSEVKTDQPEGSVLMVTVKVVNADANVIAKDLKFIDWVD